MSTTSYIEDDTTRFTLLTASPTGVTLIEEGRMQVLLGHNIAHDSFHNAEDNFWNDLPTKYVFKLVVEKKLPYCQVGNQSKSKTTVSIWYTVKPSTSTYLGPTS